MIIKLRFNCFGIIMETVGKKKTENRIAIIFFSNTFISITKYCLVRGTFNNLDMLHFLTEKNLKNIKNQFGHFISRFTTRVFGHFNVIAFRIENERM